MLELLWCPWAYRSWLSKRHLWKKHFKFLKCFGNLRCSEHVWRNINKIPLCWEVFGSLFTPCAFRRRCMAPSSSSVKVACRLRLASTLVAPIIKRIENTGVSEHFMWLHEEKSLGGFLLGVSSHRLPFLSTPHLSVLAAPVRKPSEAPVCLLPGQRLVQKKHEFCH